MRRRVLAVWLVLAIAWLPIGAALHQAQAHGSGIACSSAQTLLQADAGNCHEAVCLECLALAAHASALPGEPVSLALLEASFLRPQRPALGQAAATVLPARSRGPPADSPCSV